jgi:hypothetical protein
MKWPNYNLASDLLDGPLRKFPGGRENFPVGRSKKERGRVERVHRGSPAPKERVRAVLSSYCCAAVTFPSATRPGCEQAFLRPIAKMFRLNFGENRMLPCGPKDFGGRDAMCPGTNRRCFFLPRRIPPCSNVAAFQHNPMNCELKTGLLLAYQSASSRYSKAVSVLAAAIGPSTRIQYDELHIAAEQARLAAAQAKNDFEVHLLEHGCDAVALTAHY